MIQVVRQPVPALGSIRVVVPTAVTKELVLARFTNAIFQVVAVMVIQDVFLIQAVIIVTVGLIKVAVLVVAVHQPKNVL